MRSIVLALLVVAWSTYVLGQPRGPGAPPAPGGGRSPGENRQPSQPYHPAVPTGQSTTVVGWGGYSTGGGTAAGNAMNGMASMISAAGDYNLSTSAAAVNMTQAQKQEIQNRQDATNAYFEMRAVNQAAVERERGARPTAEQMAHYANEAAPRSLQKNQVDPVSGRVYWPSVLQSDPFASPRGELDQLFAQRAVHGSLGYSDQTKARQAIDSMYASLKDMIRDIPPQDYSTSRGFLRSLGYAAANTDL